MNREKNSLQKTIEKEVRIQGAGIHTGEKASVKLKPAPEDNGIIFKRTDIDGSPEIPAMVDYVSRCRRGTILKKDRAEIMTVEHLLAALYGLEIDNLYIEVSGLELPATDGSAKVYTEKILQAGIKHQKRQKKYYSLKAPVVHTEGDSAVIALPADNLNLSVVLEYKDEMPGSPYAAVEINKKNFIKELAPARTYCFEKEIDFIRSQGLGKGGNTDNTVVISGNTVKNTELRFKDEFVRHKMLDFLGDLSLLGRRVKARIIALRSGHRVNVNFTRKLKKKLSGAKENMKVIDADGILDILPHRYPFLMVDRIVVGDSGKFATGFRNVTVNEPFFKGHFPERPVFPSTLIVEFMAQSSAVLFLSGKKDKNMLAYFMIIEKARFFKQVKPPQVLKAEVELLFMRGKRGKVKGKAYTQEGEKVAEAEFMFALVER